MNALLKIVLSLSLSGTILILALLLLRPLCRNRLSWRWQYYIWLLVIARLLLPLTPETSITGYLFRQAEGRIAWSGGIALTYIDGEAVSGKNTEDSLHQNETGTDNDLPHTDSDDRSGTDSAVQPGSADVPSQSGAAGTEFADSTDTPQDTTTSPITKDILSVLCTVWLVMALLLFVRRITIYQSFVKYVNAGSVPVDDIALLEQFGQVIEEQNVHRTIDLCVNNLVSSPLLIGFLHTRIVLPTTALSKEDFYHTILHELTHYKRRDMFYKWLVQLTICLHWFNPFVYLIGYEINRLCELSCDERVISTFNDNSRKSYGDTLLNAIGTGGSYKDALASVTLNESKELLKERLDAIMKYKEIPKAVQMTAVFITGILIGGAAVLGAYAAPTAKSSSDRITISDTAISSEGKTADNIASPSDSNVTVTFTDSSDSETASDTGNATAQDSNAIDQAPDYRIEYDDGTFYILADDASEADKPISSVTNGYNKLTLVRKDAYYSFGSWTDSEMQNLVRHITSQCRTSLENGRMTQEDVDIVIVAATEIQEAYCSGKEIQETYAPETVIPENNAFENSGSVTLYAYTQSAYYQAPYIIEIGYNLTSEVQSKYSSTLITLSDQHTMPVSFSAEAEKYLSDEAAISAVTRLIERMVATKATKPTSLPLEFPFIVSMEYLGNTNLDLLAEKYYDEEMLTYFGAIFLELDANTQLKYLDHMFEDENISFFACCISKLEETDTKRQKELVNRYILKAYKEDKVNFFAVLAGELDEEARKSWLERCKKDGKTNYYYILSDADEDIFDDTDLMNVDDYFDEWEDEN